MHVVGVCGWLCQIRFMSLSHHRNIPFESAFWKWLSCNFKKDKCRLDGHCAHPVRWFSIFCFKCSASYIYINCRDFSAFSCSAYYVNAALTTREMIYTAEVHRELMASLKHYDSIISRHLSQSNDCTRLSSVENSPAAQKVCKLNLQSVGFRMALLSKCLQCNPLPLCFL